MRSEPVKGNPLNKAGTQMDFVKTGPLSFRVPKTYWYGEPHPMCCYKYSNPYRVWLTADFSVECVKEFTVGFLNEVNEMQNLVWPAEFEIGPPVQVSDGRWKVLVEISEFDKWTQVVVEDTSQYMEETRREEVFHEKQFLGLVGVDEGGIPDLFDVRQVYASMSSIASEGHYFYSFPGEDSAAFLARLQALVRSCIRDELEYSLGQWDCGKPFQESRAKRAAGYNAAFKYHCTYESKPGFGPEAYLRPREERTLNH